MSARSSGGLCPSIITALEIRGLGAPDDVGNKIRAALELVVRPLGRRKKDEREGRLLVVGSRAIRVAPIKRGGTLLFWELIDLVHVQAELANNGILVHGACAMGQIAEDEHLAFGHGIMRSRAMTVVGPGIAEAERLCDQLADVPRIIVDSRLIREAESNEDLRALHHTVAMELGYIRQMLRLDADGLWFVDYLSAFRSEVDEPSLYLDFLRDHARMIERGLNATTELDRNVRGWLWLREYHNSVVSDFVKHTTLDEETVADLRAAAVGPNIWEFPLSIEEP